MTAAGAHAHVDEKSEELRRLKARVAALEARLDALQPRAWLPVPAPPTATDPAARGPAAPPASVRPMGALGPATPEQRAARTATTGTGMAGANWLALAGILVLALGVVFFLKLAYDRGWVPLAGRYAIGILGGLGLWALGDALRNRVDVRFAQALGAGGAVIAYVTVYIGYALPAYREALGMTLGLELALLAVVSIALAGYALWRRFELLAATAVALATILLAPAGEFSRMGLLYAVFLDTALLLAAAWRGWLSVVWVALVGGNVAIAFGIGADVDWRIVLASIVVLNGTAVAATARGRGATAGTTYQAGLAILLAAAETGLALDEGGLARPFAWSFLAFGLMGLLVGALLRRHGMAPALVGTGLLLVWPSLHLDNEALVVLVHACLGGIALAVGHTWPRPWVRLGARIVAVAAWASGTFLLLVAGADGLFDDRPVLATAAAAALALGAGTQWALERRAPGRREPAYGALATGLAAVLVALAFDLTGWAITVSWAAVGLVVVVAGLALRAEDLRLASFGLFAFVLVRIFTFDIAQLSVVGRVLAFLATGALLLVAAFLYARTRRQAV